MICISTQRLSIKPSHKNCWSIFDKIDGQMIGKLFFRKQWFNIILKPQSLKLGVATEASYGLMKALNSEKYKAKTKLPHAQKFLHDMGFTSFDHNQYHEVRIENLIRPDLYTKLNKQLNINTADLNTPIQLTATQLVDSDTDCFNRPTKLHPQAHQAWQALKQAAMKDGVILQMASAFRSMNYQAQLIQNKIKQGQDLSSILNTNTAPGHSEHHTGCAIDITTDGVKPLTDEFDQSNAFEWLTKHAIDFGYLMSYPKDNQQGIIYEPWHWCYQHQ